MCWGWWSARPVMGKAGELQGDSLAGFDPDPDEATLAAYLADPLADPHALLRDATTRLVHDLFAYTRTRGDPQPQPASVGTLSRETHVSDLAEGQRSKIQHGFSYSDGFGREIQQKVRAEPGPITEGGSEVSPRWVGSGWTIFNNKGKPVRRFEPFFTATHRYEFVVVVGVSSVLFYDPVERVVATAHPNDTWEKVAFDAWHQRSWDVNDAVLLDPRADRDVGGYVRAYLDGLGGWRSWYERRVDGGLGPTEQDAAEKTTAHADTPSRVWLDTLARPFLTVAHNRVGLRRRAPRDAGVPRHRGQRARGGRRQGAQHHALRLRPARQPRHAVEHGGRGAADPARRHRPADPLVEQPRLPLPHRVRRATTSDPVVRPRRRRRRRAARGAHRVRRGPARRPSAEPAGADVPPVRRRRSGHQRRLRLQGQPASGRPAARSGVPERAELDRTRAAGRPGLHQPHPLAPDRAAAEHDEPGRQLLEVPDRVAGQDARHVQAGDRGHGRRGPGGQQQAAPRHPAARDHQPFWPREGGVPAQHLHARLLQGLGRVRRRDRRDRPADVRHHRLELHPDAIRVDAEPVGVPGLGGAVSGRQQRLARHAAHVQAVTAEPAALHQRDPGPKQRGSAGADQAGRAAAHDEQVERPIGHARLLDGLLAGLLDGSARPGHPRPRRGGALGGRPAHVSCTRDWANAVSRSTAVGGGRAPDREITDLIA